MTVKILWVFFIVTPVRWHQNLSFEVGIVISVLFLATQLIYPVLKTKITQSQVWGLLVLLNHRKSSQKPSETNTSTTLDKKKKNRRGDASWDIEDSAVRSLRDASMREVTEVASHVRLRFGSLIKHLDSLISQDSDFVHRQHGSFFFFCPG